MAIARPVTKTIISTTGWGIPVTDQVNANTTAIAALQPGAWANVPTLQNSWVVAPGSLVRYRKIGDIIYIEGGIKSGTVGAIVFVLPTGFRPTYQVQRTVYSGGGANAPGGIAITVNGELYYQYGLNNFVDIGTYFPTS